MNGLCAAEAIAAQDAASSHQTFEVIHTDFIRRSKCLDANSRGLATPVDEQTGIPLPILPILPSDQTSNTSFSDFHHHFHPERQLVPGGDAKLALRRSRGQDLPRWLHEHYHRYFAGPEIPKERSDIFRTVVLACAGVVPKEALDFSNRKSGPKVVRVTNDLVHKTIAKTIKHEGLRRGSAGSYYRADIGIFFANYAIEQSLEDTISQSVIDEFLSTKKQARRKELGNLMIKKAILISIDPIVPVYADLRRDGLVHANNTDLYPRVRDFFVTSRTEDYHQALDRKFTTELQVA